MKEKSLWMSIIRVSKVHLDYICFAFFLILSISSDICLISGPLLRRQYQVFLEKKKSNGFWDWFAHAYVYLVSTFYTHKALCMHVCICEGHVGVLMEQIYVGIAYLKSWPVDKVCSTVQVFNGVLYNYLPVIHCLLMLLSMHIHYFYWHTMWTRA